MHFITTCTYTLAQKYRQEIYWIIHIDTRDLDINLEFCLFPNIIWLHLYIYIYI